ncbi:MAG: SDR family NAD(P)-dependent oxidoreductase [Sphingomonadaceae bacterium]
MSHLLIFGPGYSAGYIAGRLRAAGWQVSSVTRATIDDRELVRDALKRATHILSSVPPDRDGDPVLARHADAIAAAPAAWVGYLSSTGVYGDSGGAWLDESAPVAGRRPGRNAADLAWQQIHDAARVFRLPGIYGPGRSALERVAEGRAHRIDLPGQVFSRIHVDDIAGGVIASFEAGRPGVYNLADDLPAPQNDVIAYAAPLLGLPVPPLQTLESAALSAEARAFYAENRRIANGKARRLLGWQPRYADFRSGLRSLLQDRRDLPTPMTP